MTISYNDGGPQTTTAGRQAQLRSHGPLQLARRHGHALKSGWLDVHADEPHLPRTSWLT